MAVLQKIRNRGVLLVVVIALALVLFILGDALNSGQAFLNLSKQQIGEVNGEELSIQDYQTLVDDYQTVAEIQGTSTSSEDVLNQIKDQAWQQYVNNALIEKECESLGISVTDEEVLELIKNGASQLLQIPAFANQQTGRYDYSIVQNFTTEYKNMKDKGEEIPEMYEKIYKYYLFVQKSIRQQALATKYQALLANCLVSNPVQAKQSFNDHSTESTILLASIPFSTVDDKDVNVSDADIQAKYNEDKELYKQLVETRDIKYIDVQVKPSKSDIEQIKKEVNEAYGKLLEANDFKTLNSIVRNSNSATMQTYADVLKSKNAFPQAIAATIDSIAVGTVVPVKEDPSTNSFYTFKLVSKQTQPDSVLFRQIGVPGADEKAIAKTADSIYNAIKAGASFKEIAKKYNQTADSSWITTSQYENAALDAENAKFINNVYSTPAGEIAKVTLSNGVTSIIQVMQTKNPITKYNVASVVKEIKFSDETYSKAYNKFSSFVAKNRTLKDIEANAEKEGYAFIPFNSISSSNHTIAGIHATREALKWVFEDAKVNDISPLYECGDNDRMILVALTGINQPGYVELSKLKDMIKSELVLEKKGEKIKKDVANVKSVEEAKGKKALVDTLRHVNFSSPTFVPAVGTSESIISAAASKAKANDFVGPVQGNQGVYFFKVLEKKQNGEKFDAKQEKTACVNVNQRIAFSSILRDLYEKAGVVDNRYLYF